MGSGGWPSSGRSGRRRRRRWPPSVDGGVVGADERSRFLTAAYRAAPIDDRPRNIIAMLKDVPPADIEAMLLRHAKADGEALCDLGQRRAQAVKDWMVSSGGRSCAALTSRNTSRGVRRAPGEVRHSDTG